jgi:hypothetical protein
MMINTNNNYEEDLAWASRRSWDMESAYNSVFDGHVRVPDDTPLQKDEHVDLLVSKDNETLYLEEKCIRNDWPDIFIEVWSTTKNGVGKRAGWFLHKYPAKIKVLLHFIFPHSNVLLDFKKFRAWAKPQIVPGADIKWRSHTMPTVNQSQGYLCPISEIPADCWYQPISGTLSYQRWHYLEKEGKLRG